jgi:hypothetical protein
MRVASERAKAPPAAMRIKRSAPHPGRDHARRRSAGHRGAAVRRARRRDRATNDSNASNEAAVY